MRRALRWLPQMLQQGGADAVPLMRGKHIGVADQIDVAHRLDAHDADQRVIGFAAPELDPCGSSPARGPACKARASNPPE